VLGLAGVFTADHVRSQNRAQHIPGWCAFLALISITVLLRGVHLLRIAHSPIFDYHHFFPPSDMYLFDQWSQRIAGGDVLGRESYQPVVEWQLGLAPLRHWKQWYGHPLIFYKAPFYAYLVALLYRLFRGPVLPLAVPHNGGAPPGDRGVGGGGGGGGPRGGDRWGAGGPGGGRAGRVSLPLVRPCHSLRRPDASRPGDRSRLAAPDLAADRPPAEALATQGRG